jgi:hypothetical protein
VDTTTLVEDQIDVGQRLLDRLEEEGFIVSVAAWVKPTDEDQWSLYIATPALDQNGTRTPYNQVIDVLQSLRTALLTGSYIKLVSEKAPIVQELLDILRRYPHRRAIPSPRSTLGGTPVDEVYVYARGKVEVTVYGMVFREEPASALHLSLEPHNPHSKLTVESGGQRHEYPAETGIDWVVAAPEGATLERDELNRLALAWDLYGHAMRSSANEVWSLANLREHGFRFLHEPA